jgi:hypothetical protein
MATKKNESGKPSPRPARKRKDATRGETTATRLVRIEEKIAACTESNSHIQAGMMNVREDFHRLGVKIDERINGDGKNIGLLVKIDRLEQTVQQVKMMSRIVVGTFTTLVVGALWHVITTL